LKSTLIPSEVWIRFEGENSATIRGSCGHSLLLYASRLGDGDGDGSVNSVVEGWRAAMKERVQVGMDEDGSSTMYMSWRGEHVSPFVLIQRARASSNPLAAKLPSAPPQCLTHIPNSFLLFNL
jgi:hypothetical protein